MNIAVVIGGLVVFASASASLLTGTVRTGDVRRSSATGLCMIAHGQLPKFTPPPGTPTLPVSIPSAAMSRYVCAPRVYCCSPMPCRIVAGRVRA